LPHVAKSTYLRPLLPLVSLTEIPVTDGKFTKVLHFDGKALVEEHIRSLGIPATFLLLGGFMTYTLFMLSPVPSTGSSKAYKLSLPVASSTKWPLISVTQDTGNYVKAILLNREKVLGKQICAAEKEYTLEECVGLMREKAGLDVTYEQATEEDYRKALEAKGLPEVFRDEMCENMRYVSEYGFFGGVGLEAGHEVSADMMDSSRDSEMY
jgi:hypothetical protein